MNPLFAQDMDDGPELHNMLMSCTNLKDLKSDGFPNSIEKRCEISNRYFKELKLKSNSDYTETTLVCIEEPNYYIETVENHSTDKRDLDMQCYVKEEDPLELKKETEEELIHDSNLHDSAVKDDENPEYSQKKTESRNRRKTCQPSEKQKHLKTFRVEKRFEYMQMYDSILKKLQMHNNVPKRRFECDICDKSYSRRASLQTHQRTHKNGERKRFKCDICDRLFSLGHHLRQHKRIHENGRTKRFECDICGKLFLETCYLLKHKQSHEGSKRKRYECDVCDKWYFYSYTLKKHKQIHYNGRMKRFGCDICGKLFFEGHHLLRHKQIHQSSERTRFECDICDKTYLNKYNLKKHKRTHQKPGKRRCDTRSEEISDSQQSMNDRRNSFEAELMTVDWLKEETFEIKTEIDSEEIKCSASLDDFVNSPRLMKYNRDDFAEGPTIVTSLERETFEIKTEIKQEDESLF